MYSSHNFLLDVDSYKLSHYKQYPPGTTNVSSYVESRGGKFDETVFFGIQAWIKKNVLSPITKENRDEFVEIVEAHGFEPNVEDIDYIIEEHNGYLPLEIQAVPEGSVIPTRNVLAQIVNTDERVPWLTSYVETSFLRSIWYPTTVATLSREVKKIIYAALVKTSDNPDEVIMFKLHDFGARGATSEEAAALGGMGHLINFMGTDTLSAIVAAKRFYHADMAGFSIPASEHSTITSWGMTGEKDAYANMLKQFGGDGKLVACVSDSYDIYNAVDQIWGNELQEAVQKSGGTLIVRPDSGDPVTMPIEVIERLMEKFGYTVNSKGYKVLPNYVRVIQGDGIHIDDIKSILDVMESRTLAADNIAFGMGGGLLQKVDRDTQKFAMKASAVKIDGEWRDVFKDPISDRGKTSKKGRQALIYKEGVGYRTVPADTVSGEEMQCSVMQTVYRNGTLYVDDDFETIRNRAKL